MTESFKSFGFGTVSKCLIEVRKKFKFLNEALVFVNSLLQFRLKVLDGFLCYLIKFVNRLFSFQRIF